jgi:hypothetical protein
MEPEDSSPRSQELSTGPYPEPDRSSPYLSRAPNNNDDDNVLSSSRHGNLAEY